jgi:pseudaminic acid cytidylyltransferase
MNICVIPARGGSKRIPRKNIKDFNGKPIISYSIEAAFNSNCFDNVIVSTDDDEIAEVAKKYGAQVPFLRPKSISDDYTSTVKVVAHSIEAFKKDGFKIDSVCCIYATSPFVQANDINKSLDILKTEVLDYCFSVTSYEFPIQRSIRITKNMRCEVLQPKMISQRSQDLEEFYHDAGQFYWGMADAWLQDRPIFSKFSYPYLIPRYRVQDIDNEEDWVRAEIMQNVLIKKNILT